MSRWITEYEQNGHFEKPRLRSPNKVLDEEHVKWIKELYENEPTMYLKETRERFFERFGFTIHHSTISRTLHKIGFTRKVLERRALQIKKKEIDFFCKELQSFHWDLPNLVFLDEVSFTNTEMFRTYGYGQVGERILAHGKFQRLPRISLLCFLGLDGLLETSITSGNCIHIMFYSIVLTKQWLFRNLYSPELFRSMSQIRFERKSTTISWSKFGLDPRRGSYSHRSKHRTLFPLPWNSDGVSAWLLPFPESN